MAQPNLEPVPNRRLPDKVSVNPTVFPPHTARESVLLREQTGKTLEQLTEEGHGEGVLIWFTLRRLGYEPSWDEALDVLIEYDQPDPFAVANSTPSPPSAGTGA